MSPRGLALIAVVLTALLAAAVALLIDRLGVADAPRPMGFVFTNHLLTAPRGRRVVLRPMQAQLGQERYYFGPVIAEPELDDELAPAPHLRVGIEVRDTEQDAWTYDRVGVIWLSQLGALTLQEWLEEIRPVRERTREGGERILLRVAYGHERGSNVFYFHDPERPVPGLGWVRHEHHAPEMPAQVFFALPVPVSETE